MKRQVVMNEYEAQDLARMMRQIVSYGQKLLSAAQVENACRTADDLYPLSTGPWRPKGWSSQPVGWER